MIKGVAYYRVSTQRQGKSGLGLQAQRQSVQSYAQAYQIKLINEFTEIETGKNDNRPKLQKALRCCQRHNAVLLIAKLDRLSRNLNFITTLQKNKVRFIAVDMPGAASVIINILGAIAQYERELISTRIKEALQAAKSKGVELGMQGKYVLSVRNKRKADIFAKRLRPLLMSIMAGGCTSVRKITAELNERKVPTFRPGSRWHSTSVFNLLNRLNINTLEYKAAITDIEYKVAVTDMEYLLDKDSE